MSDISETVRIVSTHPASQGPFVEIDKSQYDAKVHKLYKEDEADAPAKAPAKAAPPAAE